MRWLAKTLESKPQRFIFLANLIVLCLSLIGELSLFFVMAIYWAETVIIGLFMLVKFAAYTYEGAGENVWLWLLVKMLGIPLFSLFFGFATFMYGIFLFVIYTPGGVLPGGSSVDASVNALAPALLGDISFLICVGGIFVAQAYRFFTEFVVGKNYRKFNPDKMIEGLVKRFLVMHLMIFITLFVIVGLPWMPVAFLVLVKTILDILINRKPSTDEYSGRIPPTVSEVVGPVSIIGTIAMLITAATILENRKHWPASPIVYAILMAVCVYFGMAYLAGITEHVKKGNFGAHLLVTIFTCFALFFTAYLFRETNYRRLSTLLPLGACACVTGFAATALLRRKTGQN